MVRNIVDLSKWAFTASRSANSALACSKRHIEGAVEPAGEAGAPKLLRAGSAAEIPYHAMSVRPITYIETEATTNCWKASPNCANFLTFQP